jgi:3-oxoacyl-[acyl-carrier protein] reductase
MDTGLDEKVAWVTGASAGLGLGSARSLAREGARVAMSSRDPSKLDIAARDIGAFAVACDVSDPEQVTAAAVRIEEELGPVDVLVANPGSGPPPGPFVDTDEQTMRAAFELLVSSAWTLTKAVLPGMLERRHGVIVYVTSASTKEVLGNLLLSNMMRPAVVGMAKTLSKEVGDRGVRVLCAAPGRHATDRVEFLDRSKAHAAGADVDEIRAVNEKGIALRRYGTIDEFGDLVAFLASDRASFLTGITVAADGGGLDGLLS